MAHGLQVSNANGFVQIDGEKQGYALYDNYRIKLKNPQGATGYGATVYVPKLSLNEESPPDMAVIKVETANAEVDFSVENTAESTDAFGNVVDSATLIGINTRHTIETDILISIFRPVNALQLQAQSGDWGIEVFDGDGNLAFDNRQYSVAVESVVSGNFANSSSKTVSGEALLGNTLNPILKDVSGNDDSRVINVTRVGADYQLRASDFNGVTKNFGGGSYSFAGVKMPPNQIYQFISVSKFTSGNTPGTVSPGRYEAGYSSPEGIGSFGGGNNPPGATWARVMFISTDDGASEGSNKKGAWKITITGEWPEDRLKYIAFNAGFIGVYQVGQDSGSGGTYRYSVGGGLTTWSWGLNSVGDPENTEPNWLPFFFTYIPFQINARWNTENTD